MGTLTYKDQECVAKVLSGIMRPDLRETDSLCFLPRETSCHVKSPDHIRDQRAGSTGHMERLHGPYKVSKS